MKGEFVGCVQAYFLALALVGSFLLVTCVFAFGGDSASVISGEFASWLSILPNRLAQACCCVWFFFGVWLTFAIWKTRTKEIGR